ncbi:MAG: efflux RND transporter periplasmic adaptor subunit [Bdellovibrionales bacterium]
MKSSKTGKWKWIVLAAVGLSAGLIWSLYGSKSRGGGPTGTRLGTVKRGDLIQRVTVSGQVQPSRRTVFVAPYSGYIQKIFVNVGKKVVQGSPIISITSSLQSPEPVFPIRAPFSGTVVSVNKYEGEYVTEKDTKDVIARVDDLDHYFVLAKAPETDAVRIRKEMPVEIRINALQTEVLKGVVKQIDLAAEEADGWRQQQSTFRVLVEILNPPPEIRSGQSAIVDIVTRKFADVLYLEHEFINQQGDQHFVIDSQGERREIKLGNQSDLAAEITSGLREGDRVRQVDFLKILESGE